MTTTTEPARTRPGEDAVHFGLVELDLLATHTGVPFPFPLRVPSFGRIPGEREVLMAAAARTLTARGLADETGPCGAAAELVSALRQYRGAVHLVLAGPTGATGHVAMIYRSSALLCERPLDGDQAATVRIRRIAATAVAAELLAKIPQVPPARAMPVTLPTRAVDSAAAVITGIEDDREQERRLRDLVRDCGGTPDSLDELSGLLSALNGRGQLGATRRARHRTALAGDELSWLDGERGRVRISRTTEGWVSVNPLRRDALHAALHELAVIARAPR